MTIESVKLKPGVLFLSTLTGGVLMDIEADRFLALTPLSALVWGSLASGRHAADIIDMISAARGVHRDRAETLLASQLRSWERAELINAHQSVLELPQPKALLPMASTEFSTHAIHSEPLVPSLLASLFIVELKYRRAIGRSGLARTLTSFQGECGRPARAQQAVIVRTLRNYHALRRAFRQGHEARDCLFRSLALAAVLRRQGIQADLCIGIVDLPFSSHAWVEAHGRVLNETLHNCERYAIIARF